MVTDDPMHEEFCFFLLDGTPEGGYTIVIMRQNYRFSFNYWWWPKETFPTGER